MNTVEQAYDLLMNNIVHVNKTKCVDIIDALNRISANNIFANIDIPPFDRSMMDGYACKADDVLNQVEMTIVDTIFAGDKLKSCFVQSGQCIKIMTGAAIPKNANCVVIFEDTKKIASNKIQVLEDKKVLYDINNQNSYHNLNIQKSGIDFHKNDKIIHKGILIKPQHIALLASMGLKKIEVFDKPRIAILVTGSELVSLDNNISSNKIYDSTSYIIAANLKNMGLESKFYGIIKDNQEIINNAIQSIKKDFDILITTGGVSVGDKDFIPDCFLKSGLKIIFNKVSIKPGKHFLVCSDGRFVCFGIPGNPIAAFILFHFFIKPYLYSSMGHNYNNLTLDLMVGEDMYFTPCNRDFIIPINIIDNKVYMANYNSSSHIHAYNNIDHVALIPKNTSKLKKDSLISVKSLTNY